MFNIFLFLSNAGLTEWLVIGVVILIFFGGKKIPEFMRGLGRGIREFNDAKNEVKTEIETGFNDKVSTSSSSVQIESNQTQTHQTTVEPTSTTIEKKQKKIASNIRKKTA